MEVSIETKKKILEQDLQVFHNSIYALTVKAKVMTDIGNEKQAEPIAKEIETLVKMKDKYEEILGKLDG